MRSEIFDANEPGAIAVTVEIYTEGIGVIDLIGGNGSDTFELPTNHPYSEVIVQGGNPDDGSDVLVIQGQESDGVVENVVIGPDETGNPLNQIVTGLAGPITLTGTEAIAYTGHNSNDNLTVNLGAAATEARLEAGPLAGLAFDQLSSDTLPTIVFADSTDQINNFTVLGAEGAGKEVTFVTSTIGAATNYFADLGPADTLVVEGSVSDDSFTAIDPDGMGANDGPRVVDNTSGVFVQEIAGAAGPLGQLRFDTRGGTDRLNVQVATDDLLTVPIVYDGGTGSDLLNVQGTPLTPVTTVNYTPGANPTDGKLTYDTAVGLATMSIEFTNLEPVLDQIPAATLVVNGTAADNAISYSQGPLSLGPRQRRWFRAPLNFRERQRCN